MKMQFTSLDFLDLSSWLSSCSLSSLPELSFLLLFKLPFTGFFAFFCLFDSSSDDSESESEFSFDFELLLIADLAGDLRGDLVAELLIIFFLTFSLSESSLSELSELLAVFFETAGVFGLAAVDTLQAFKALPGVFWLVSSSLSESELEESFLPGVFLIDAGSGLTSGVDFFAGFCSSSESDSLLLSESSFFLIDELNLGRFILLVNEVEVVDLVGLVRTGFLAGFSSSEDELSELLSFLTGLLFGVGLTAGVCFGADACLDLAFSSVELSLSDSLSLSFFLLAGVGLGVGLTTEVVTNFNFLAFGCSSSSESESLDDASFLSSDGLLIVVLAAGF